MCQSGSSHRAMDSKLAIVSKEGFSTFYLLTYLCIYLFLGVSCNPRARCMPGKCSVTEPHSQPSFILSLPRLSPSQSEDAATFPVMPRVTTK